MPRFPDREFDNWDTKKDSFDEGSRHVSASILRVVAVLAVLTCTVVAVTLSISRSDHRANFDPDIFLPQKDRAQWESVKDLAYQDQDKRVALSKSKSRNRVWRAQLDAAASIYNSRKNVPPDLKSPRMLKAALCLTAFADMTKSDELSDQRHYVDLDGQAERVYRRLRNLEGIDRDELFARLKAQWRFPLQLASVNIAVAEDTRDELHVFTYCYDTKGVPWRIRFELVEGKRKPWRIVDWQLLDWMVESSGRNSELYRGDAFSKAYALWRKDMAKVDRLLDQGKKESALVQLRDAELHKNSSFVQGEVLLRSGAAWERLGFHGKALKRYRSAAANGVPGGYRNLVSFFHARQADRMSRQAANNYAGMVGKGPWVLEVLADLGECSYREALAFEPGRIACLVGVAREAAFPGDKFYSTISASAKSLSQKQLDGLFNRLVDDGRIDVASEVAKFISKRYSTAAHAQLLAGLKLRQQGITAGSFNAFKKALKLSKTPADSRRIEHLILRNAWLYRHAEAAYLASSNRRLALRKLFLQHRAVARHHPDWLRKTWQTILYKHAKTDPARPFIEAELVVARENIKKRVELLERAVELLETGDPWTQRICTRYAEVMIFAGLAAEAREKLSGKSTLGEGAVKSVARLCVRHRRWSQLAKLVDSEQPPRPVDYFRAELALARGDVPTAKKHLAQLSSYDPAVMTLRARVSIAARTAVQDFTDSASKKELFAAYVKVLRKKRDNHTLQRLAKVHMESANPGERMRTQLVRAESYWQSKRYRDIANLLRRWPPEGVTHLTDSQSDRLAEIYVRSLLRLKKKDTAIRAAQEILNSTGQSLPMLLARLAIKSRKVLTTFERGWTKRHDSSLLMFDPDMQQAMNAKRSRLIKTEPPRLPKHLPSISVYLLRNAASTKSHAELFRECKVVGTKVRINQRRKRRRSRRRNSRARVDQYLSFKTNIASFTVRPSKSPISLANVDLHAIPDHSLRNSLRNHKAYIEVTLHGYLGQRCGLQVDQLIAVIRSLADSKTTVLVINDRAVSMKHNRKLLARMRSLDEFPDSGALCHLDPTPFKPRNLRTEQLRRHMVEPLRWEKVTRRVTIHLGLKPNSSSAYVTVKRAFYRHGELLLMGNLSSRPRSRPRLRPGMPVVLTATDVVQVRR